MKRKSNIILALAAYLISASSSASLSEEELAAGAWRFSKIQSTNGTQICLLMSGQKTDSGSKNLSFKSVSNKESIEVFVSKNSWRIPDKKTITVSLGFMDNQLIETSLYNGDAYAGEGGTFAAIFLPEEKTKTLFDLMRKSKYIDLRFPSGNEPVWSIPIFNHRGEFEKFITCTTVEHTQPFS